MPVSLFIIMQIFNQWLWSPNSAWFKISSSYGQEDSVQGDPSFETWKLMFFKKTFEGPLSRNVLYAGPLFSNESPFPPMRSLGKTQERSLWLILSQKKIGENPAKAYFSSSPHKHNCAYMWIMQSDALKKNVKHSYKTKCEKEQ